MMIRYRSALVALCVLAVGASVAQSQEVTAMDAPISVPPADIATPPDLPAIGKWMIAKDGLVAH